MDLSNVVLTDVHSEQTTFLNFAYTKFLKLSGKFTTELRMALHTLIKTVELSKLEMDILDDYSTSQPPPLILSHCQSNPMRFLLLFAILGQAHSHVYTAVNANRERKNQFGPFSVTNQDQCELACNCARGDASEPECSQLPKAIPSMDCRIYYYTASWCSFLGDFTMNTCILPIVSSSKNMRIIIRKHCRLAAHQEVCGASGPRNRAQPLVDHALTLLGPELALRDAEIVPANDANWFFCGTENIPLVVCPGEGSTTLSP
ncbi:hypothetical protein PRIPAC_89690 [Pristionchus pacificus]|uniref:Uncharacterized protein n=1 Tax=Pristionchus pacificus TaxID=54126 RepID=A0A2A6B9F2_PRIPA|nr:hypothetical protein PRIPAC_89690 [Pristionchus pacificus]|eukprot:PDM62498.1 hypothetical protein PRIPAC_51940 [Pristionchus pacificus]